MSTLLLFNQFCISPRCLSLFVNKRLLIYYLHCNNIKLVENLQGNPLSNNICWRITWPTLCRELPKCMTSYIYIKLSSVWLHWQWLVSLMQITGIFQVIKVYKPYKGSIHAPFIFTSKELRWRYRWECYEIQNCNNIKCSESMFRCSWSIY